MHWGIGGGTEPDTNLGLDDATSAASGTATFTFTIAGTYIFCYMRFADTYSQVGTSTVTVSGVTLLSMGVRGRVRAPY